MLVLKVFKNFRYTRDLRNYKCGNVCFQSTESKVKGEENKARRFLKPPSKLKLKPINVNFIGAIFSGSFDKTILEYPQVFEEREISTIINHGTAVESFLSSNPNIKINPDTISELKRLELLGLSIPQNYGGAGYNRTEINFLLECVGIEPQIGQLLGCSEDYGCRLLNIFGNEEQKAKYLPQLAEGQIRMTFAFLENSSVIDFSNFVGYSVLDVQNKGYIINTRKKWVHNADVADLIMVLIKTTSVLEGEGAHLTKFNVFLVERDNPTISIHKVLTNNLEDFNFFEIDFQDTFVPKSSLLGGSEICGVSVLKVALSHGFLTDAVICCSVIKQLLHAAIAYSQENKVFDKLEKGYIMVQNNLSSLTMYAYVLESAVYLLSGRFDTHREHELYDESVLVKIIAIDMLKSAIQKYIGIVGHESLQESGALEKALKLVEYYSILDENIEYLKMMVGGNGLTYAGKQLSDKVRKLRNIHDNFSFSIKELLKFRNAEKKYKLLFELKQELHSSLRNSADSLETSLAKFLITVEENLLRNAKDVMENEHVLIKFAEIVAYIYAVTACLSRASSSICYDFKNYKTELTLTDTFTYIACNKIESLIAEEVEFLTLSLMYEEIGKITFKNKGYPAEHPLTRTY